MKRKILLILLIGIVAIGCLKSKTADEVVSTNQQILIKVDAEHNDGGIVSSPIVVVR